MVDGAGVCTILDQASYLCGIALPDGSEKLGFFVTCSGFREML